MHHQLMEKEAEMAGGPVEAVAALQSVESVLLDRVTHQTSHVWQSTAAVATLEPARLWVVDVDVLEELVGRV